MARAETPAETPANPFAALAQPQRFIAEQKSIANEVQGWVENSYDHWKDVSKDWRMVVLPDMETVNKVIEDGRYYCKTLRDVPLSIQVREIRDHLVDGKKVGTALVYRVRDRVNSGRKATTNAA
jgi:hypothetical protein